MDVECNCFLPSKVNLKCVYKFKCRSKCITHKVKWSMCDAIYIGNTQQTFKKKWKVISPISYLYSRTGKKPESFADHFWQHFNSTMSCTDIRKYMTFKVVNQINLIGAMKTFTKPSCNLFMEELLTILKNLRDKRITSMNKNSKIYGACQHKMAFHRFCLSTDDPVFNM